MLFQLNPRKAFYHFLVICPSTDELQDSGSVVPAPLGWSSDVQVRNRNWPVDLVERKENAPASALCAGAGTLLVTRPLPRATEIESTPKGQLQQWSLSLIP